MSERLLSVRVVDVRQETAAIRSYVLAAMDGEILPPVEPGAHVDVHFSNGLTRSYSLSNGIRDKGQYRLTIARDVASRGGSVYIHDTVQVGDILQISAPRNNFALNIGAPRSEFIAGGIGVTPFLPMMARLNEMGLPWRLHYCARTRNHAALLDEIDEIAAAGLGEVVLNFDAEPGGVMLDLPTLLGSLGPVTHVYCCGPAGMLDAFRAGANTLGIDPPRVHFEYFASNVKGATEGGFVVELTRSRREIRVPPGQSILHAITEAGVNVPYSCEQGICGACETKVLAGTPDHRDSILSDAERAESATMMICCSGSKGPRLVLDL